MDPNQSSLPPGRSTTPLTEGQQLTVSSLFLGFDVEVPARYDEKCRSHFEVIVEGGEKIGVVFYGPDIYPGKGDTASPNSTLPMKAAVAHEVVHFNRWRDGTQLNEVGLELLDEALTSLEATVRYPKALSEFDISELTRDAMARIVLFRNAIVTALEVEKSLADFVNPVPRKE